MSANIKQVFDDNPSTTVPDTALIYLGLSPFGTNDDSAITGANLFSQISSLFPELPLSMANGGTGASLSPENGALLYSNATNATLLSPQNNAALSSNATGIPTWITLGNGEFLMGGVSSPFAASLISGNNIVVNVNGSGLTVSQAGAQHLPYIVSISSLDTPYETNPNDFYISVDTSIAPVTIYLPPMPNNYRQFWVKDRTGNAQINNIIITTMDGTIDFDQYGSVYIINNNGGFAGFTSNNTSYEVN